MGLIFLSKAASGQSPLEAAESANKHIFWLYVLFLFLAFIGTVYFTWKLFDSGNGVQQAIQDDAKARIESAQQNATVKIEAARSDADKEAKRIESEAGIKIAAAMAEAGHANERASELEKTAAELRKQNIETATKLAEAQLVAAKAQLELKQYVDSVEIMSRPKFVDHKKFVAALEGKPKGSVKILYNPDFSDAMFLAEQIKVWLGSGTTVDKGAGWEVEGPIPLSANEVRDPRFLSKFHSVGIGISLRAKNPRGIVPYSKTASGALTDAIGAGLSQILTTDEDRSLPDENHFIVVIGE